MTLKLGDTVPDFTASSSQGEIRWHNYIDGSWAVLFSHPADYTPVCTTELGTVAALMPEFEKKGFKVAALSCNDADSHKGWIKDIEATSWCKGQKVGYPIIADAGRDIVALYGMIDPDAKDAAGLPMSCRGVYIPLHNIRQSVTGVLLRSGVHYWTGQEAKAIDSIPRLHGAEFLGGHTSDVIHSLGRRVWSGSVATPVDWKHGEKCMVVPTLSDEAVKAKLGDFEVVPVPSEKRYIRMTADPGS